MTARTRLLPALLFIVACHAQAAGLGRLFYTPEQRARMDLGKYQSEGSATGAEGIVVNGIVQKRGGSRTVWINGVPQPAGKSDERSPESVSVTIPGQSRPARAKVGQRILPEQPPGQAPAR